MVSGGALALRHASTEAVAVVPGNAGSDRQAGAVPAIVVPNNAGADEDARAVSTVVIARVAQSAVAVAVLGITGAATAHVHTGAVAAVVVPSSAGTVRDARAVPTI